MHPKRLYSVGGGTYVHMRPENTGVFLNHLLLQLYTRALTEPEAPISDSLVGWPTSSHVCVTVRQTTQVSIHLCEKLGL